MKKKNLFAASSLCYGLTWQNIAWEYAAKAGFKNVDLRLEPEAMFSLTPELMIDEPWHGMWQISISDLKAELLRQRVTPLVSFCITDFYYRFGVEKIKKRIEFLHKMGIKYCITAPWPHALPGAENVIYDHWKEVCDHAEAFNMVLYAETLGGTMNNARACLKTIKNVGRKNLKVTFATSDTYYRNEGLNSKDELELLGEHVGLVLLRDFKGQKHEFNFPALGDGTVDFPMIFETLADFDFHGPYLLVLEGHKGVCNASVERRHEDVLKSVQYLQGIGVWG